LSGYKAILFDLDDTLLNRAKAVDKMFSIILEKFYEDIDYQAQNEMLQKFREYDNRGYGDRSDNNKIKVLKSFFDAFPPKYIYPCNYIQEFWNNNFPHCFSINQNTIDILNTLKMYVKAAIVTNGLTQRQKAKIINTNLNGCFDIIIISEDVGFSKPDRRIFELALNKLNVQPEATLFVGDDIVKDIGGCQNANINGIWFNPNMIKNNTKIKPYDEINSLERLLSYFI